MTTETYGTAPDGTNLQWIKAAPVGRGPWPGLGLFHGGEFRFGGAHIGGTVVTDLTAAGFIVFSVFYRLDQNKLPGQTSSGLWPQQTDDCKMAIRAIHANKFCNGAVVSLGGSAGGTHAASVAIEDETTLLWTPKDRVRAAACISGCFDFTDKAPFVARSVQKYCATKDPQKLLDCSPVSFVDATASPILLTQSVNDPMPMNQYDTMVAKLNQFEVPNEHFTVLGSAHSFDNWPLVREQVIAFLRAHV